jgi:hypothetical protein
MATGRQRWWEDTQNAALLVVAVIVAIIILGFIADWTGYFRTSPPQSPVGFQSEELT